VNWRDRTAQIVGNGAGCEPTKPPKATIQQSAPLLSVLSVPVLAHSCGQELACQLRLYADRNGFTQADFEEALQVATAGDQEGWLAYIKGQNETRH